MSQTQPEIEREAVPNAAYVETLEDELRRKEETISKLRNQLGKDESTGEYAGTPHRSGEVASKINEGPATPEEFDAIDAEDLVLNRAIEDGPEAFVDGEKVPVYPVHERAHEVLRHAPSLAREQNEKGSALFLHAPVTMRYLEAHEGESIKHTQVRRVFETIRDAGSEYPRPPTLHKNEEGVIELVIYDYPRLFDHTAL